MRTNRMIFLGIDPGLSGAACLFSPGQFLSVIDIETRPIACAMGKARVKNEVDCELLYYNIIEQLRESGNIPVLSMHMERVGGRGGNSAESIFCLGDSMGSIRATALLAAKPEHEIYSLPATWKRNLNLSADKQKSIDLAIELEPEMRRFLTRKMDHDRSEAFLLAYLAYKYYEKVVESENQG